MNLLYRLVGLVAAIDEILSHAAIFYVIKLNWIFFLIILYFIADGLSHLGIIPSMLMLEEPRHISILKVLVASGVLGLLVTAWLNRNTIFRPTGERFTPAFGFPVVPPSEPIDLLLTCRLSRGAGDTIRLHDFPARCRVDHTGSISLETFVVQTGSSIGLGPTSDASGSWSVNIGRGSLMAGLEEGWLYWGLDARRAFRITHPNHATGVIVSVPKNTSLEHFLRTLETVIAVSLANEEEFKHCLQWEDQETKPGPTKSTQSQKNSSNEDARDEVAWNKLIDFSE